MRLASAAEPSRVLDVLRDEAAAVRGELGIQVLDRAELLEVELAARPRTRPSIARMTVCWRPMASTAGSCRNHAAADFCVLPGAVRARRATASGNGRWT